MSHNNASLEAEALAALGYRSAGDVIRSPFNFGAVTGDLGAILSTLEERDLDRVPVALVRAGEGWAAVIRVEDFPSLRGDRNTAPRRGDLTGRELGGEA